MSPITPLQAPIVLSGPSGSGKSTLLEKLFEKYPNSFGFSVSHTTRKPRENETPGKSYHYVSREEFEGMVADNKFIESAEFSGNLYGTSVASIDSVKAAGRICVLDLEVRGVQSFKTLNIDASYIFIQPPSIEELEKRLRARGSETEETLSNRLKSAQEALDFSVQPGSYDKIIINDNQETAMAEFEAFILSIRPSIGSKPNKHCDIL
ncbi:hypothetical protein BASA50_010478 [Batrachochytrium salamandrivorans]|uniref:guanylate kinase n=1 Tax=Batrachochytrium salamandrivorans TaxID=1357716 RepID=A0ABQ8EYT0_9FUNG|nr:hypothetical protein BASA62_009722 [Batrachochytrium salamandrivorans]KAH6570895.1 hypothetical protein BASA60_007502 [Batrachochytrium salamandrivorans]KAH6587385.1 hypothetical protein BASA61_006315 [Batrachochytrium salamandrivorans]KAH6588772.1 hypothetical protein BASA50_010478 [Batrachochytrium salamandrivorans]KAH9272733.1 guanylate kinase [Batrachochytrium salamandrivorans]